MLSHTESPRKLKVRVVTPYDDQVPAFYTTFHCEAENVREVLAPEIDYWTARDPTLICAPPGMGKTTLACEELLPRALSRGRNILFLVNRVALATQLKRKVLGLIDPEVSEYLSEKGLRKLDRYKNICVLTYHSLPAFIKRPENAEWVRNVQYVVADEIHVVTSDSSFNYFCGYYLKLLTQKFQHAIRVYMTATEWDMLLPLAYAEKQNYLDAMRLVDPFLGPRKFIRYHFSADYRRHIDLHFFSGMEDILQRIDERPSERWILFMASKKEGRELAKQLKGRAVYLDADSKDTEAWAKLLQNSRYGEQVLITTAVLDCGVNIIDPTVRNLAIFTDDRTQLIQMMGRKRFSHPDERVNLFVYDIDEKTVSRRYQEGEALCQLLERYEQSRSEDCAKMAQEFWLNQQEPSLRHYFGLSNGHLVPNEVAFFALKRKMNFYRALLEGNMTFREAVRGWLGLPAEEVPKAHEEDHCLEAKLEAFCEAHLDQDLTEEEISYFREMVIRIADQVGSIKTRPDRLDSIGREALNKRLGTFMCPYRLARGAWRIERAVEETED